MEKTKSITIGKSLEELGFFLEKPSRSNTVWLRRDPLYGDVQLYLDTGKIFWLCPQKEWAYCTRVRFGSLERSMERLLRAQVRVLDGSFAPLEEERGYLEARGYRKTEVSGMIAWRKGEDCYHFCDGWFHFKNYWFAGDRSLYLYDLLSCKERVDGLP